MKNEYDEVRWLLVGTGDIVRKRVAGALAASGTIVGVVGGEDRARAIAAEHGGRAFDHLERALDEAGANAAYVATPVFRHKNEALLAIAAGLPVLVEKPLGLDGADAEAIADAAQRAGVTAGCAYYRRCSGRYTQARQAIAAGELGTITLVRTTYHGWFAPAADDPKRWRIDPKLAGGGALADMGSHMFDLLIDLFGLPRSVFAYADRLVHEEWGVEDSSAIAMQLDGGAQVLASFGWNSQTWVHEFEIVGSLARLRWCPADTGPVVRTAGRNVDEFDLPPAENVHLPLVEDFVRALREGGEPICPLREAVKTNRLLDAIYESARTGKAVCPG